MVPKHRQGGCSFSPPRWGGSEGEGGTMRPYVGMGGKGIITPLLKGKVRIPPPARHFFDLLEKTSVALYIILVSLGASRFLY